MLGIILYVATNVMTFGFLMLAVKWTKLMQEWEIIESELSEICNQKHKMACIKKIRSITTIILIGGMSKFYDHFKKSPFLIVNNVQF